MRNYLWMDDKTTASCQTNISSKHYVKPRETFKRQNGTVKKLLGWQNVLRNHYIAILFNPVLQVCPFVPILVFTALSILPFQCFKRLFLCFTSFAGSSRRLNFDKFRNTAPLILHIFTCRSSLLNVLFSTLLPSNRASSQSVLKAFKVWFMLCLLLMTSIQA